MMEGAWLTIRRPPGNPIGSVPTSTGSRGVDVCHAGLIKDDCNKR